MPALRRASILLGLVIALSAILVFAGDKKPKSKSKNAEPAIAQMDDDKRIIHALNRLTFGVRPGDVERVRAMGLDKWLDQQLHPDKIDDGALDARLASFRTLHMSTREMVENFPPPQVIKAVENGRMSMPSDPAKRAIYESRLAQYQQRQENKAAGANTPAPTNQMTPDQALQAMLDARAENNMSPEERQKKQKQREDDMYADLGSKPSTASPPAPATNSPAESMMADAPSSNAPSNNAGANNPKDARRAERREEKMYGNFAFDELMQKPPEQRYKEIIAMSTPQRMELAEAVRNGKVMQLTQGMKPEQQETIMAIVNPQAVVGGELASAKVLRAIYSERQLDEVMTDFWFNHFNVFINKGPDRYMITAYERDVIRPHALGKFKDLLVATAKSPAMLFYLDNWESVGPNSELAVFGQGGRRQQVRRGPFGIYRMPPPPRPQQQQANRRGLNENYAREIMELHTLGVDGGYTQKDVTELAKVLTGWSIDQPQRGGSFRFNERAHEPGDKHVLGHKIGNHGESEGMEMLEILAHHPSTAKFISKKLAMRFVSDNPPQSLIDRMAATFVEKDGDIRDVLRTMFNSPEFWAADTYRAKMKTPLEFVASSVRASGVEVQNAQALVGFLQRMGMPLYAMQPPTGYSMKAEAWVNSAALLTRMNFALTLGTGRLPGTTLDPQNLLRGAQPPDSDSALAVLENNILAGDISAQTHAVIQKQLNDPQMTQRRLDDPGRAPNVGAIAGLIMGSPEFQRR